MFYLPTNQNPYLSSDSTINQITIPLPELRSTGKCFLAEVVCFEFYRAREPQISLLGPYHRFLASTPSKEILFRLRCCCYRVRAVVAI